MLKHFVLWLAATLMALQLKAQQQTCNYTISGRILEASNGLPIADVAVYLPQLNLGAHTNMKGEFLIQKVCAGTYTLVAKHLNHEQKNETILVASSILNKTIYLTCHTDTLHQAVIKGARFHWEDVSVTNKLQGKDLQLSNGSSLGKALEKVNGVYSLSTGSHISKPVIRGMHSNRVLIMNNELRQEGQQWGNEHAPEIDQSMAKEIEVVKGAQSIRYGSDVIGGLILVNPAPLKLIEKMGGEVNLNAFSNGRALATSGLVEGTLLKSKALTWRAQGAYKLAGNGRTPDYFLKNTGLREHNYSLSAGYKKQNWNAEIFHSYFNSDIGIFAGSHIGNLTDLYAAFERDHPLDSAGFEYHIDLPYQHVQHRLTKAKLNLNLNRIGTLGIIYGIQQNVRQEYDKTLQTKQDDGSYKPALHFKLITQNIDISLTHLPIKRFEGSVGFNGFYQTNNYYGNYFIPNYQKQTGGLYWIEKWHKHAFSIEGGLRFDVNHTDIQKWENKVLFKNTHAFNGFAATLAGRYQFPYFTIHINGGTAWRAPFANELYSDGVHHSAASYEIGDRTLRPERNYNSSITLDFNYRKKLDMEVTLFSNYIQDYIHLQPVFPATLTIRGAFPTFKYTQVNAWFYGVEYSSGMALYKNMYLHARANMTFAKDLTHQQFLVGIPPIRLESDIDIPIIEQEKKDLALNIGGSYTFRQFRIADSADYVPPSKGYWLIHAHLIFNIAWGKTPITLNIGAENILNTRYRDYMNRNRYFTDEQGRNIYLRATFKF